MPRLDTSEAGRKRGELRWRWAAWDFWWHWAKDMDEPGLIEELLAELPAFQAEWKELAKLEATERPT